MNAATSKALEITRKGKREEREIGAWKKKSGHSAGKKSENLTKKRKK